MVLCQGCAAARGGPLMLCLDPPVVQHRATISSIYHTYLKNALPCSSSPYAAAGPIAITIGSTPTKLTCVLARPLVDTPLGRALVGAASSLAQSASIGAGARLRARPKTTRTGRGKRTTASRRFRGGGGVGGATTTDGGRKGWAREVERDESALAKLGGGA